MFNKGKSEVFTREKYCLQFGCGEHDMLWPEETDYERQRAFCCEVLPLARNTITYGIAALILTL